MIRLIAGEKGTGKTKRLIDFANDAVKSTDGHLVFIDYSNSYMYDLHHAIRFIVTGSERGEGVESFPLSNYREFIGFVCGILSMDNDITGVYVDSINKILKNLPMEDLEKLLIKLDNFSNEFKLDFTISVGYKTDEMSAEISKFLV